MKVKITDSRKFIRSMSISIFIIILLILLSNSVFSHQEIKYKTIYVSGGDTIWSIAREEIKENQYFENKPTKEVVYSIQKINNLSSGNIYVGQKLLIPIGY